MPHIMIKGISEDVVCAVSKELPAKICQIVHCREDEVLFQYDPIRFYYQGKLTEHMPVIVQIHTAQRPHEQMDGIVQLVTEGIHLYTDRDVVVYFVPTSPEHYYYNGINAG